MDARSPSGRSRVGRYELFGPFATGGMASVHFGKLSAAGGFRRTVAIKVPHAALLRDPAVRAMFLDEARIVARIKSPNVVATLDVLDEGDELYQVMEYAHGPSLSTALKAAHEREEPVPIGVALAIAIDVLEGLHAAHEAVDDAGAPLEIVHRDVSPQNVLLDEAGVAKVIDFGIASAANKLHLTQPGEVKGKVSYMAPEQIEGRRLDRRADVYAAGVLLYETLTGRRPFGGDDFTAIAIKQTLETAPEPHTVRSDVPEELSTIVMRALEKRPQDRFPTARAMAEALTACSPGRASARDVAEWLRETARAFFVERDAQLAELPQGAPSSETGGEATLLAPTAKARSWRGLALGAAALAVVGVVGALWIREPTAATAPVASAPTASPSVANVTPTVAVPTASTVEAIPKSTASVAVTAKPLTPTAKASVVAAPPPSTATAAIAKPPCCSGELRLRVSDCVDNCPPGT